MENLHGWIFTYNQYENNWMAVKRDDFPLLFSDIKNKNILKSNKIETLIEIINKTNGDISRLGKQLRNER